jgi:hypothetical protein
LKFFTNIFFVVIRNGWFSYSLRPCGASLVGTSFIWGYCCSSLPRGNWFYRLLYYKTLVYIIHLLSIANNKHCISHTTSTCIEKFVVLESLEWVHSPTSLQVLVSTYHALLDYLIFCKDGVSPYFLFRFNLLKHHMVL